MAGTFGIVQTQKQADVKKDFSLSLNEVFNELSNVSRRLRIIEERYLNLRKKELVTEQNMLSNFRKLNLDVTTFKDEMNEMNRTLTELREDMRAIVKELKDSARKEDVEVMKKYLELWSPIKFVTLQQAERIARDVVEQELEKRSMK